MNEQQNLPAGRQGNNLATFIAGVVIGAALTYLFGTKSGQKLRDELLKEGNRLLEKMGEGLEDSRKQLEGAGEKIQEEAQEVKEKLAEGVHQTEETVKQVAQEVPQHIEEIQKKGRRFFFRRHRSES